MKFYFSLKNKMASFEEKIRSWVKIDDEVRRSQEHIKELREKRNQLTAGIHTYVKNNEELRNATINISDGRLRFVQTQTPQSLTFKFLHECLAEIIPNKETIEQILTHIKSRRNVKTASDIKRFYSNN